MDYLLEDKQKNKSKVSAWVMDYDKNTNSNMNKGKKELMLNSRSDYSELKQKYANTQLKNISINFGFPSRKSYKYKNSLPLTDFPMFEQRNYFYYDKDFQLFKNKSVSRYGEKNNNSMNKSTRNDRVLSPQHTITTSIKKKKIIDDKVVDERNKTANKNGKDIYEVEVVNQVLYDDINNFGGKKFGKELENEWGDVEKNLYENEKNKKNNLLNSVHVEIEKENGEKDLKIVEFTKDNKPRKEPCIKIRYTIEDKICLNTPEDLAIEDQGSIDDRRTMNDSAVRSYNYKTNTDSTFNNNYSISSVKRPEYKKDTMSEIILRDSKSSQNFLSPSDTERGYFSGSISSVKKSQNYKQKYYQKRIDSEKNEGYSSKTKNLMGLYSDERGSKFNKYTEVKKSLKTDSGYGIKSPRIGGKKEEIQVKIEKGLASPISPIRKDNDEVRILSPRFKFKERDKQQDLKNKSMVINYGDRYKSYDEEEEYRKEKEYITDKSKMVYTKQNIIEGKGLRDKYLKKQGKEDKLKIINIDKKKAKYGNENYNNISSMTTFSPKPQRGSFKKEQESTYFATPKLSDTSKYVKTTEDSYLSKSQYLEGFTKKEGEKTERPRVSRRIYYMHKEEEKQPKKGFIRKELSENKPFVKSYGFKEDYDKKGIDDGLFKYRMNLYEADKNKKENLSEDKSKYMVKRINIEPAGGKNEKFERFFDLNEDFGRPENKIKKDKERKEIERKEKERKERQRLEIEKEIEKMEKEKEKLRVEKQKQRESVKKQKEEKDKKEKERIEKEKKEKERIEKSEREKRERLAQERREKERLEREKQERIDRLEREKREKERERERLELERQREKREREKEREKQELERQRQERERQQKLEREKQERERQERDRQQKLEREKQEREKQQKLERLEREKQERERQQKVERERQERERQQKLERLEWEKQERERQQKIEREKLERERQQKVERERIERERQERDRQQKLERERQERERQQKVERLEWERQERVRREKIERDRKEKERSKSDSVERESRAKIERERKEKEKERKMQEEQFLMDKDFKEKADNMILKSQEKYNLAEQRLMTSISKEKDKDNLAYHKSFGTPTIKGQKNKTYDKNKMHGSKSVYDFNKNYDTNVQKTETNRFSMREIDIKKDKGKQVKLIESKSSDVMKGSTYDRNKKDISKQPLKEVKSQYNIKQKEDGRNINIGKKKIKEIEISKEISNKGRDFEDKRFRYSSIATEKKPVVDKYKEMRLSYQKEYGKVPKKEELSYTRNKFKDDGERDISSKFIKYKKDKPIRSITDSAERNIMAKSYITTEIKTKKELDNTGSLFQRSYALPEKETIEKKETKIVKRPYLKEEPDLYEYKWTRSQDKITSFDKDKDYNKDVKSLRVKSQSNFKDEQNKNKNIYEMKKKED